MISSVGFSNPLFFMGIVEDISNHNALPGRVRVRAFGIHPPAKTNEDLVPTDSLPWAPVVNGSGGAVAKMPEKSEWVFGMFLDGRDAQHPIVLGTFPGMKGTLPAYSGTEYDNDYEMPSNEAIDKFNEPVGGVASEWAGTQSDPQTVAMAMHNATGIESGDGAKIEELAPVGSQGSPDKLTVIKSTTNGSNIQVGGDGDTEYLAMYHKTGAHLQFDEHGNQKTSSPETVQTWAKKHIQQRADGSFDISAGDNMTIRVDGGKATIYAGGNIDIVSRNDINMTASGKINMNAGEGVDIRGVRVGIHALQDNIDIFADQKMKIHAGSDISINGASNFFLKTNQYNITTTDARISSSGNIHLKGSRVNIDDIVYLASSAAASAVASSDQAVVSKMPAPSPRNVAEGERSMKGTTSGSNIKDVDDAADGSFNESVEFNGDGLTKGIGVACNLQKQGYSKAAAAAIVGNIMHESDQFTADIEYGTGIGRGWLQWSFGRRDSFEKWAQANNLDVKSDSANYGFLLHELDGHSGNHWTGGGSTSDFKKMDNYEEATKYFMEKYERPDPNRAHLNRRTEYAKAIYESECPK